MKGSESDIRATGGIRPIRLIRDAEVLRIPRPPATLDDDLLDEAQGATIAPALE